MNPLTPELPLNVDSTMISAFRQCPRKFFNEFCLGLRPSSLSIDLHAGACFASAMENTYTKLADGTPLSEVLARHTFPLFMDQWGDFQSMKDTSKTRERVWQAIEEYFLMWAPLTDPVQPLRTPGSSGLEFTFGLPLTGGVTGLDSDRYPWPLHSSGQPFIYSGRFDMLALWGDKTIVRDEKTTTSIGAAWAEQWDLRSQFMGYVWACQRSGLVVDTVCVRGVGILKTKITLVEAFKSYSESKITRWLEQLRRDLWRMRRSWDEGYFDYNFADACSSYGGCVFRDACGSDHPERWLSQFEVRRWNPLNKNPIEPKGVAA